MKDSWFLRFLYRTVAGRWLLKLLVNPAVSKAAGALLDTRASRCLIRPFMRREGIGMEGIEVPPEGFASFNAFFCRKRLPGSVCFAPEGLCSPCDGYLTCLSIEEKSVFHVKRSRCSLAELLGDEALAAGFLGGTALIFRLTPADYHRYCYVDDGYVMENKRIGGVLHCVRPVAAERVPVYVLNSREYVVFESAHFGRFVQMEVGALLVGRICNHDVRGAVRRGDEKGYFEYGGSTVILLLARDTVRIRGELLKRSERNEEVFVRQGEKIGEAIVSPAW